MELTQKTVGDVVVIAASGRFDMGAPHDYCRRVIDDILNAGCRRLVVDLSGVLHIDTTCIGLLIGAHTRLTARGGALRLLNPSRNVGVVLRMAGLHTVLLAFQDEDEAVRSFVSPAATD